MVQVREKCFLCVLILVMTIVYLVYCIVDPDYKDTERSCFL